MNLDPTVYENITQLGLAALALGILTWFLHRVLEYRFKEAERKDKLIETQTTAFLNATTEFTAVMKNHIGDVTKAIEQNSTILTRILEHMRNEGSR